MKRKEFLKLLGIGSVAAVVAPKVLIPEEKPWIQKMSFEKKRKPIIGDLVRKEYVDDQISMACTGMASFDGTIS